MDHVFTKEWLAVELDVNIWLLRLGVIFIHATNSWGMKIIRWEIYTAEYLMSRKEKNLAVAIFIQGMNAMIAGLSFTAAEDVRQIITTAAAQYLAFTSRDAKSSKRGWNVP